MNLTQIVNGLRLEDYLAVFVGLETMILIAFGSILYVLRDLNHDVKTMGNWSDKAKEVALFRWEVRLPPLNDSKRSRTVVHFTQPSNQYPDFSLFVSFDHEDIEKFRGLKVGEIVHFRALACATGCAFNNNLSEYLRLVL